MRCSHPADSSPAILNPPSSLPFLPPFAILPSAIAQGQSLSKGNPPSSLPLSGFIGKLSVQIHFTFCPPSSDF
jgi:hypothetical protein